MSRNLFVSVSLSLFLWLLPVVLIASNSSNPDIVANPQLEPLAGATELSPEQSGKSMATAQNSHLGIRSSTQVGSTWNDMQQNGSMGRQIVIGGGWVHNIWNFLPGASTANRNSSYFAYDLTGVATASNAGIDPITGGAGFASIGYDPTSGGRAAAAYHRLTDNRTRFARGDGLALATFVDFGFSPAGLNCQGVVTGAGVSDGPYFWPKVAVDMNGSGEPLAHVVATEYAGAQVNLSLVHYKTNLGMTGSATTCALWLDSITTVSAVVEQDPNSGKVAIVWLRPADWAHLDAIQQRNNDVVFMESTDMGTSWLLPVNITNYSGSDLERAYTDVAALYASDGCLHILWTTSYFDSASANVGNQGARLYHWDKCSQCRSLLADADNYENNCRRGVWNKNISKMSLSECTVGAAKRLYATYTYFVGDDNGDPAPHDCSQAGWANGEIYAQASISGGSTWGPPQNLTNTTSDNCTPGNCNSEHWSSAAPYITDSLRIQYILDRDPGAVAYTEGSWTNNPVMNLSYPCFTVAGYSHVSSSPDGYGYPFHAIPLQQRDTLLVLTNSGNIAANYTRSITYLSGSGWLSFPDDPPAASVPVGCVFSDTLKLRVNTPAAEAYLQAVVEFVYDNGDSLATLAVPVEVFSFNTFYVPLDQTINTVTNRLNVNQAGRVGSYEQGSLFTYTTSGVNYLRDGSLILGTSGSQMSWLIYAGSGGQSTPTNSYGPLYAASGLTVNSSHAQYVKALGRGVNRDSTIGFEVTYYAPKSVANSDFYLARFSIYPGPHNSSNRIDDLVAGFAVDWDLPADDGSSNISGGDDARHMVYQQGTATAPNSARFGALAVIRADGHTPPGGFVWENARFVAPLRVYQADSVWNKMNAITKFEGTSVTGDLNSIIVAAAHETVLGQDSLIFTVIFAGQLNGTLNGLKSTLDKAKSFYCQHVSVNQIGCPQYVCGDANGNGAVSISDVVYLINYIFAGGPAPNPVAAGDVNCSGAVSISDAVYTINYIFAGGPAPCANCP